MERKGKVKVISNDKILKDSDSFEEMTCIICDKHIGYWYDFDWDNWGQDYRWVCNDCASTKTYYEFTRARYG